jgi:hypothetical protein
MTQTTLTDLANKYGTDKGDVHFEKHNYTPVYEELMGKWKSGCDMLEIGINDPRFPGAGMLMWLEWMGKECTYTGVDINIDQHLLEIASANRGRANLYYGDQTKPMDLKGLVQQIPAWDFIIDDGIHTFEAQVNSFFTLFPYLNRQGVYFIEDCHAKDCAKTIDLFKNLKVGCLDIDKIEFFCNDKLIAITKY